MQTHFTSDFSAQAFAMPLVCPLCKADLDFYFGDPEQAGLALCTACTNTYRRTNGCWDFSLGTVFEDGAIREEQKAYESEANADTVHRFWLPTLRDMLRGVPSPRVLSVGCGVGIDVDMLCDVGIQCFGIDCGHRGSAWRQRRHQDHLLLADGLRLPFPDASFDVVFCGCVFPHVGTVGDTNIVARDGISRRAALAREMTRVLRPGGKVIASSPNRWFPLDLFHGRENGGYKPRFNPPSSRFLLSAGDYRQLFGSAGCGRARLLPVRSYWGFIRSKRGVKGRLLALPVRLLFTLAEVPILREGPLNPWLIISMEKVTS